MTESKNYQITLLSDVGMQSNLFKDSLERGLQLTVNMVSVDDLRTHDGSSRLLGDFVLFDFQYLDDDRFNEYSQIKAASETAIKEIVINCPKDVTSTQLFKWRNLVGVFYIEDDISLLIKGMEKIMNDEMWLSRKVAQDYIEYFR